MAVVPFCAWGEGPDVGINLSRTPEQAARIIDPHLHWFLDFTADEALELAAKLTACANQVKQLERTYNEYVQVQRV